MRASPKAKAPGAQGQIWSPDRKLDRSTRIAVPVAAPADVAWKVLARPGNLIDIHPFCCANTVERWPGVGARDTVHFYSGSLVHRNFVAWEEGAYYTVIVTDRKERQHAEVEFRISPDERGPGSVFAISVWPMMFEFLPVRVREILWDLRIRSFFDRYFSAVGRGLAYHVETGRRVRKDQFGRLRGYS